MLRRLGRLSLAFCILSLVPLHVAAQEPRARSESQLWADTNGDGSLQPPEIQRLVEAGLALYRGPHPGGTPADGQADLNRDGFIGPDEIDRARTLLMDQLPRLPQTNPDLSRLLDLDGNGLLDRREAQVVVEYLWVDPATQAPHPSTRPLDRVADRNGDGMVGDDEVEWLRSEVVRGALLLPPEEGSQMVYGVFREPVEGSWDAAIGAAPIEAAPAASSATTVAASASTAAAPAAATTRAVTAATPADLELSGIDFDEVFPVFHKYYDDHPVGTAKLKNSGGSTAEKVRVQLTVKGFMTDKKLCTAPDSLAAGEEKEVQLYALFSEKEVLSDAVSAGTKALATVSVEWSTGGLAKSKDFTGTIRILDRNAMSWDDDDRAAAFVNAKDPVVMKLAKITLGAAAPTASRAVDTSMVAAIAVHQLLGLYGMSYVADPKSPYATLKKTSSTVDSLQFPQQSLEYKAGDCDDLAILEAALLEAVGVESAFVTVPGHIFVAFALKMAADTARGTFLKPDDLVYDGEKAWVPLEVTEIKGGFVKAWESAARQWRESDARKLAVLHPLADAWVKYEPVAFTGTLTGSVDGAAAAKAYKDEETRFIKREIAEREATLQAEIAKGKGKPETINKLGVLYAKFGLDSEARKQFELAIAKGEYAPALVNMGNLCLLGDDAKSALGYFERAARLETSAAMVLLGLARANHELENFGNAKDAYEKLRSTDAKLAAQFAYLDLRGSEASRAADASGARATAVWYEP